MDTLEKGLETLIVSYLRDVNGYRELAANESDKDFTYDPETGLIKGWVEEFINATQPEKVAASKCFSSESERTRFYTRLSDKLTKDGVVEVLRNGFKHNGAKFDLYYATPSELNDTAKANYAKNIFGVVRQVRFSRKSTESVDVVIFLNGLPVMTMELKNHYTGQTVENAIKQYRDDRDPGELLFRKKRCAVHLGVDDTDVYMCSELKGRDSWFLPFNRGVNGGKGNPPIPGKTMTSYLWEAVLTKSSLSDILENYAQTITETDRKTKKTTEKVIWPRYHQLDAVRKLLAETGKKPTGRRFLIQHSAGSGKSNTITWLAFQLAQMLDGENAARYDSVLVVTDRVNLDKQIRDNIRAFAQLDNVLGWAEDAGSLKNLLDAGKKIVISTIHKFGYIIDELNGALKDRRFAIVIDEAHSSQAGEMANNLARVVSGQEEGEEEDVEDMVYRIIKGRKLAKNANYYAFTATPKNKTLELFGEKVGERFEPFHEYSMKQAIEEGFILDVVKHYTPYRSYYQVVSTTNECLLFDKEQAPKRLKAYVEAQPETIAAKAKIIVDHFCTKVFCKIGGKARAMVVTSSIDRAIEYFEAISRLLKERGGRFKAIVAFTDKTIGGELKTEAMYNGFASSQIEDKFEEEPYRILVVADKFQTGYDQPLLHTMYVDKQLRDVKAVQTLSRLNRCCPKKTDTFVLDFANDPDAIREAFQKYYKGTVQDGESDVNKLSDLIDEIERKRFYREDAMREAVRVLLKGADAERAQLDSMLDFCVERFKEELLEDEQVSVKGAMKRYLRIYPFFASIMPYESVDWEEHYLFYAKLYTKLPKIARVDGTAGLVEYVDFDKYRIEKQDEQSILLQNIQGEVDPVPVGRGGQMQVAVLDTLQNIVDDFNRQFGGEIEWKDVDEVKRQVASLPDRVMASDSMIAPAIRDQEYDKAEILFNNTLNSVVTEMGNEKLEFMTNFFSNEKFRDFISRWAFECCRNKVKAEKERAK